MITTPFVLLAAGRSERMGQPKAQLDFKGRPWLRVQVGAIRAQTQGLIRVVLGPQGEREIQLLEGLEGVEWVINPQPDRGPFSSLQEGLQGLPGPVFLGPLDCPVAAVLETLFRARGLGDDAVVPANRGKGGHPVLLGPTLVERLVTLDPCRPEARLDQQLKAARTRRVEVAEPWVTLNLNTPRAWTEFSRAIGV